MPNYSSAICQRKENRKFLPGVLERFLSDKKYGEPVFGEHEINELRASFISEDMLSPAIKSFMIGGTTYEEAKTVILLIKIRSLLRMEASPILQTLMSYLAEFVYTTQHRA